MPSFETYREYQAATRPAWHGGQYGAAWALGLGVMKDAMEAAARAARRQRWLSMCSEDALAKHGRFRGWPRVAGESIAQYRARLLAWWELAKWTGTRKGILDAFALLGMTNVEIREALDPTWGRYTGTAKQRWFSVVIRAPHPFGTDAELVYGAGTLYGSGAKYGLSGDASLVQAAKEIVRRMRPVHAWCGDIIVVLSGDIIDAASADDGKPDLVTYPTAKVAYLSIA